MVDEYEENPGLEKHDAIQRVRVLVVDDRPDIVHTSAVLFEYAGFEVRTACNGYGAVEIARDFRPDIAVLDIGLPDLDGCEVARRLRADPTLAPMTLIAITAYGSEEHRRRTKAAGFDHHLVKPVHFFNLLALIGLRSQPTRIQCGTRVAPADQAALITRCEDAGHE